MGELCRKNNVMPVDLHELKRLYVELGYPMWKVAEIMNFSIGKIHKTLTENNIPKREPHKGFLGKNVSEEVKLRISKAHKGKVISEETRKKMSDSAKRGGIGYKKKRVDGYISIHFPDHPKSSKEGNIMEHILVMEAIIGRHLKEDECVHHINGKRDDNRKENLLLMTKSQHMSFHSKERWRLKKGGNKNV